MDWTEILTPDALREYAGQRSYSAGVDYARNGMVSGLIVGREKITARVQGTESYSVQLEIDEDGDLIGKCSCPYGEDGNFCKHCVAVGIAWLENAHAPADEAAPTREGLREFLETQDKAYLVTLLLEQLSKDTELQNRLTLKMAKSRAKSPDMSVYRQTIKRTLSIKGFIDYGEAYGYATEAETVVDSLQELLDEGFADGARQLTEYAIGLLADALNHADDSNGEIGEVWQHLHDLHLEATLQSPPLLLDLVDWVKKLELESDWDVDVGWEDYLPVLGEEGKRIFKEEVTKQWEQLPELKPGSNESYRGSRFRLTNLMTRFAREAGDIQAEIAIAKRDLSSAYRYLAVAELYLQAGEPDTALEWGEKARDTFHQNPDERVMDFLVKQYTERRRFAEAYDILWRRFAVQPELKTYRQLREYAEKQGDWTAWRAKCWEYLRALRQKEKPVKSAESYYWDTDAVGHSREVRILLDEGREEEAWNEAEESGCSRQLWLELAKRREQDNPADAVRVYREEAAQRLNEVTGDYSEPFRHILKIREILLRIGEEAQFIEYVLFLRDYYRRKRNFIKLLDTNRFPA